MAKNYYDALYTSKIGKGPSIAVFPDRFVVTGAPPERQVLEMPFDQITAVARNPQEDFAMWSAGMAQLAVHFEGQWLVLPVIPNKLAEELLSQASAGGMAVTGWPMQFDDQAGAYAGPIVVREYATARDFELDARAMDLAGYDILSTTQQEQRANGAAMLLAGPFWAMAAKGKAHIVVTYKRRS